MEGRALNNLLCYYTENLSPTKVEEDVMIKGALNKFDYILKVS